MTMRFKKYVALVFLSGLGGYLVLFGIASLRYVQKMDQFEARAKKIVSQLASRNVESPPEIISKTSAILVLERPKLFRPGSVYCYFFCAGGIDFTTRAVLQEMIVSTKNDLSGMGLLAMNLSETKLSGANFSGAHLSKTNFRKADLKKADFSGADLREARFSEADLSTADFFKSDLSGADLRKAKLHGADLRGVNFFYADFIGADLSEARLSGSKLSGADFRKVKLVNADLSRAVLGGARLNGADLSGADLTGADLRYADLSETKGLTQGQLLQVIMDKNTKLPEGLEGLQEAR